MSGTDAVVAVIADGVTTVTVSGDFDVTLVDRFVAAATGGVGCVEVDLAQVTFLDSAGLSALARTGVALGEQGRGFRVVDLTPMARRVIDISQMAGFLGLSLGDPSDG